MCLIEILNANYHLFNELLDCGIQLINGHEVQLWKTQVFVDGQEINPDLILQVLEIES